MNTPLELQDLQEWLSSYGYMGDKQIFPPQAKLYSPEQQLLFLLEGIFHIESSYMDKKVLVYLKAPYILDANILGSDLTIVSDTEVKLIKFDSEYSKKITDTIPSFIEKVVISNTQVLSKIYKESSKIYIRPVEKVKYSFRRLYEDNILNEVNKMKGWYELPFFISRNQLASYSQVSRKTLGVIFKQFEKNNLLQIENNIIRVDSKMWL